MLIIYFTGKKSNILKIDRELLAKQLIASANMFPIESLYTWKGEMQLNKETAVFAKTSLRNYNKVEAEIKKLHSYDTPAIYSWKAGKVEKSYCKWLEDSLS